MNVVQQLIERYPALAPQEANVIAVGELMKGFRSRRPLSSESRDRLTAVDSEDGRLLAEKLQGALPAIALTGPSESRLSELADITIAVPGGETLEVLASNPGAYQNEVRNAPVAAWICPIRPRTPSHSPRPIRRRPNRDCRWVAPRDRFSYDSGWNHFPAAFSVSRPPT